MCLLVLYRRYRLLVLLIATSQATAPVSALTARSPPMLTLNPPTPMLTTDLPVVQTSSCPLSLYLAIASLTMLLFVALFYICRRYKNTMVASKSILYLELTSGTVCVYVPIITLPACPSAYHFQASASISNLLVQGLWSPQLTLTWPNARVTHIQTRENTQLPTNLPLSWYQAFRTHTLINRSFSAHVVIWHCNMAHYKLFCPDNCASCPQDWLCAQASASTTSET